MQEKEFNMAEKKDTTKKKRLAKGKRKHIRRMKQEARKNNLHIKPA
jgi:hypothetical protein